MGRIERKFRDLKKSDEKALVAYLTAETLTWKKRRR